jgi:uncharacterized protein (TIGR00255 family)
MLMSMTGYGRKTLAIEGRSVVIELQSVNGKYLEIKVLTRDLSSFEMDLRKLLAQHLRRGHVALRISIGKGTASEAQALPSRELVKNLKNSYDELLASIGCAESLPMTYILNKADEMGAEESENFPKEPLFKAVEEAIRDLVSMRKAEGKALQKDILGNLEEAALSIEKIGPLVEKSVVAVRERLMERYKALMGEIQDPERLTREAFLLAERSDISEELSRLKSHFHQFRTLVEGKEGGVGKNLEFLIQEMHRETGTILAKSGEIEVKTATLAAKSAIEKMREQVQNVE